MGRRHGRLPFDVQRDHLPPQALRVPARWHYRPLTSAPWRMLMADMATLRALLSDPRTRSLDVVAARLVLKGVEGDMKATRLIADLIDGPVRRRLGGSSTDDPRSADLAQVIEEIVLVLTWAWLRKSQGKA